MKQTMLIFLMMLAGFAAAGDLNNPADTAEIEADIAGNTAAITANDTDIADLDAKDGRQDAQIAANAWDVSVALSRNESGAIGYYSTTFASTGGVDDAESTNHFYDTGGDYYYSASLTGNDPLVAQYHFDDDTAHTNVLDAKGNYNMGLEGGDNTEDKSVAGKLGTALQLNGVDDVVTDSNTSPYENLSSGAIAFWVYLTDDGDYSRPVCFGRDIDSEDTNLDVLFHSSSSYNRLRVDYSTSGVSKWHWLGNNGQLNSFYGDWCFIVVQHDGITPEVWINGAQETAFTWSVSTDKTLWWDDLFDEPYPANNVSIGASKRAAGLVHPCPFPLDEVRFYNRVLTSDEIAYLYNSGTGTTNRIAYSGGDMTLVSDPITVWDSNLSNMTAIVVTDSESDDSNWWVRASLDGKTNWTDLTYNQYEGTDDDGYRHSLTGVVEQVFEGTPYWSILTTNETERQFHKLGLIGDL